MRKDYAGYLFDLDGTLVDTAPDLHLALNHALTAHNFAAVSISHTRHWIGQGANAMIAQALQAELGQKPSEETLATIRDTFLPFYEQHIADHSQIYPQVLETLQTLQRRGAGLAVVTNKHSRFSAALLDALELSPYFTSLVCGDTTNHPKPAADMALLACTQLGLEPADVLFVGDSGADVGCARAAGCDVVCVRDGYNQGTPAGELGADAVIESFQDLV